MKAGSERIRDRRLPPGGKKVSGTFFLKKGASHKRFLIPFSAGVTLEDEYGVFEVTLFPDLCSRLPYLRLGPYVVEGEVEEQYGVVTVTARRFELCRTAIGVEAATVETHSQSRNVQMAMRDRVQLG